MRGYALWVRLVLHRVILFPPSETGDRKVRIDDQVIGTTYSLHDLTVFLQNA